VPRPAGTRGRLSHGRWKQEPRPLTEAERDEGYACFVAEDFRTGVAAFLLKR
jgi:hypothetical protein